MPTFNLHATVAAHCCTQHPSQPDLWVVGGGQNFGLAGSGRLYGVSHQLQQGAMMLHSGCALPEPVFGVSFIDPTADIVAAACGDGVKLIPLSATDATTGLLKSPPILPNSMQEQHRGEATCVAPLLKTPGAFVSGGFDGTARLFQAGAAGLKCLRILAVPGVSMTPLAPKVFDVSPHPADPSIVATAHGDGLFRVWDCRAAPSAGAIHTGGSGGTNGIVNSVDWNKFDPGLVMIGTASGLIEIFDMRKSASNNNQQQMNNLATSAAGGGLGGGGISSPPILQLPGHRGNVRRARWSPHSKNLILSCGFDFTVCLFDLDKPQQQHQLVHRYEHHREFVHDCVWDSAAPGNVMSCGWDGILASWHIGQAPSFSPPVTLPNWQEPVRAPGAPRIVMKM